MHPTPRHVQEQTRLETCRLKTKNEEGKQDASGKNHEKQVPPDEEDMTEIPKFHSEFNNQAQKFNKSKILSHSFPLYS